MDCFSSYGFVCYTFIWRNGSSFMHIFFPVLVSGLDSFLMCYCCLDFLGNLECPNLVQSVYRMFKMKFLLILDNTM